MRTARLQGCLVNANRNAAPARVDSVPNCAICSSIGLVCKCNEPLEPDKKNGSLPNTPGLAEIAAQQAGHKGTPSALAISLLPNPSLSGDRTVAESQTFYRFASRLAPALGSFRSTGFWLYTVLPAAQVSKAVFNALLTIETLCDLPITDAAKFDSLMTTRKTDTRFERSLVWYGRSVNATSALTTDAVSDLALILMTGIFYMFIEARQAHDDNAAILMRSMYLLAHSRKEELVGSKKLTVFQCVSQLISIACVGPIPHAAVASDIRDSVIDLALRLERDLNLDAFYRLELYLMKLTFEFSDLIMSRENADLELEDRLQRWVLDYLVYTTSPTVDPRMEPLVNQTYIQYKAMAVDLQCYRASFTDHLDDYPRKPIYEILAGLEHYAAASFAVHKLPNHIVETNLLTFLHFIQWHLRIPAVYKRIEALLKALQYSTEDNTYLQKILAYFEILSQTPFSEATAIELELRGERSRCVFPVWRLRAVHQFIYQRA